MRLRIGRVIILFNRFLWWTWGKDWPSYDLGYGPIFRFWMIGPIEIRIMRKVKK